MGVTFVLRTVQLAFIGILAAWNFSHSIPPLRPLRLSTNISFMALFNLLFDARKIRIWLHPGLFLLNPSIAAQLQKIRLRISLADGRLCDMVLAITICTPAAVITPESSGDLKRNKRVICLKSWLINILEAEKLSVSSEL